MRIESIIVDNFPPFPSFHLKFKPRQEPEGSTPAKAEVQLLIGPNGTGKSRILAAIAAAMGNWEPWVERNSGKVADDLSFEVSHDEGSVTYTAEQGLRWRGMGAPGLLAFAYSGTRYLVDARIDAAQAAQPANINERLCFNRTLEYSQKLAQALFTLQNDAGQDHKNRRGKELPLHKLPRAEKIITSLETKLGRALGKLTDSSDTSFAFRATNRPVPLIQVEWNGQTLNFNQLPDGLRVVIGWLVDIAVMTDLLRPESPDPLAESMVILMDEPETHLHPAWQRKIIPMAQELLPNAQFIIATHSPFIVMSLNDGWINRLEPQEDGTVKVLEPQEASKGDSYMSVIQELMGISEWFDPETEAKIAEFENLLEAAYKDRGSNLEAMKQKAEELSKRSVEVRNLVGNLMAQFERTQADKLRRLMQTDRRLVKAPTKAAKA